MLLLAFELGSLLLGRHVDAGPDLCLGVLCHILNFSHHACCVAPVRLEENVRIVADVCFSWRPIAVGFCAHGNVELLEVDRDSCVLVDGDFLPRDMLLQRSHTLQGREVAVYRLVSVVVADATGELGPLLFDTVEDHGLLQAVCGDCRLFTAICCRSIPRRAHRFILGIPRPP